MDVQEILEGKKKVLDFLIEKGFSQEKDYSDEEYKDGTYFKIDKRKLLVVYEVFEEEKIKETKDHFLIDTGLSHCIIVFDRKLIFSRNFGEIKYFIYSDRTKEKVSKIDRIKNIDKNGFDFIFQAGKDISEKFYESFKLKRDLLASSIKNDIEPTQKYLIAQKIFDRFFFIYFLCHKKLVKSNNGDISGKHLFGILLKQKEFLYYLKQLFDRFNLQGTGNRRILEIGGFKLYIPYLNGGLFRPDVLEDDLKIVLKNRQWEDIFEFLNSYHWIIEDIRSLDDIEESESDTNKEGYLTPEILGHVYERGVVEWEQKGYEEEAKKAVSNISERKKKGVYYTPESITDYISNNTIIPYLLDKLGNNYEEFDELIKSNKTEIRKAINILDEMKIVDPACGSGAFLIKACEVLFVLKKRLLHNLGEKNGSYEMKLNIVTESIYGVDILKGAIEISKLRLWLWLISDYEMEKEVEPLPNIEYNLMCGNSLVGFTSFKGKLAEVSSKLKEKTKRFEQLKSEYKKSHGKTSEIMQELIEKEMKSVRSELNALYIQDLNYMDIYVFKVKKDIQYNFFGEKTKTKADKYIHQDEFEKELAPFHWVLEFSEVFKGDSPGFDIVIGNPPYISFGLRNVGKLPDYMKDFYNKVYSNSSEYKINIYPIFMQRGLDLTKDTGYHSFIVPDSFLLGRYFSKIRKYILDSCKINKILFLPYIVFPGATIGVSVIYILNKNKNNKDNEIKAILAYDNSQLKNDGIKNYSYSQGYFKTIDYNRFRLFFNEIDKQIIEYIESHSERLDNYLTGHTGVRSLIGQENIIHKKSTNSFCKKGIISGSQVKEYNITYDNDWIEIDPKKLNKGGWDPRVILKPKIFIRQTGDHITAALDNNKLYHLNNVHSFSPDIKSVELEKVIVILNSNLMDYFYKKISLEEGRAMAQTDIETLEKLPIKISEKQIFIILHDYLVTLRAENQDELYDYLNNSITDFLVYELYLKDKLGSNLIDMLNTQINDISKLPEDHKIKEVKRFIEKTKSNNIQKELEKIKAHSWIKIIESRKKT